MEESILLSIKKLLNIPTDYDYFDTDIIIHINTVFMTLNQLGVGPVEGFIIEDDSTTWNDYLTDPTKLQAVKTYIYLKVRLIFDPPQSSAHIEAIKHSISEYEFRLNVAVDPGEN